MRMTGQPYYVSDGVIRNQFLVRVINKRNVPCSYSMTLEGDVSPDMKVSGNDATFTLPALGEELKSLVLTMPQAKYTKPLILRVRVREVDSTHTTTTMPLEFVGPDPRLSNQDYLNASQYLQK
jgi:hypothetical protein